MPFDSQDPRQLPFVAYVCSDAGAAVARAVMSSGAGAETAIHGGGLSGAARLSASVFTDRIVLAEMGRIPLSMASECIAELKRHGVRLIVLGEATDLPTYRALRNAGALEYFPFPVDADDILSVATDPQEAPTSAQPAQPVARGLSVGVLGATGGVGASLLAQNLAALSSRCKRNPQRTALLDADLEFGTQAIDLNRDDTRGLFEALSAPERVDSTFIGATMEHLDDNWSLYSGQVSGAQNARDLETRLPAPIRRAASSRRSAHCRKRARCT